MYIGKKSIYTFFLSSILMLAGTDVSAQSIAFPGAEGFGKYASGGRGGDVIYVTNLQDDGPGSFREAIKTEGKRIIVFDVAGTITLEKPLEIVHPNVTIAGQSAPGGGITIRDYPVTVSADNIIIRYMRFRLGDVTNQEADALGGRDHQNIIIDHCSISWAIDEGASFYRNENFTMQWSIISESLNSSAHAKGEHGYGGIWGATKGSFHHNLLAHHKSRNPRFSGSNYDSDIPNRQVDFRNNVIYNWGINSAYGGEDGEHNMVKNYYKAGPATNTDIADRIINPSEPYGKFYVEGNFVKGFPEITKNNWAGGVQSDEPEEAREHTPFEFEPITEHEPKMAYEKVLQLSGASYYRDEIDERVVDEVRTGTATYIGSETGKPGLIDSQEDVGSWPELPKGEAPKDSDRDGMPDEWEKEKGLNPSSDSDASKFSLQKNFTNIEVYLNSLVHTITENGLTHE